MNIYIHIYIHVIYTHIHVIYIVGGIMNNLENLDNMMLQKRWQTYHDDMAKMMVTWDKNRGIY